MYVRNHMFIFMFKNTKHFASELAALKVRAKQNDDYVKIEFIYESNAQMHTRTCGKKQT